MGSPGLAGGAPDGLSIFPSGLWQGVCSLGREVYLRFPLLLC